MELRDRTVLVLGGAGLVGLAVCRRILEHEPKRLVVGSLRRAECDAAIDELKSEGYGDKTELEPAWGDLFVPEAFKDLSRNEILSDPEARRQLIDEIYGALDWDVFGRSALGSLLERVRPDAIVDCVNTAGTLAYQNAFQSVADLRRRAVMGTVDVEAVDQALSTLYLPQLIRHVQLALAGMKRAGTQIYVKVGTAGTGGMGLNIPFTHSEERPSRVLLAKAGLAGAHTLLLYLMARTPGAPAVKEVKPTAAISWKSIRSGPVRKGGRALMRSDAVGPVRTTDAFGPDSDAAYRELDEPLEGVYLDAGENGLFSLPEFETLTSLGLMEFVTPEEIAEAVLREIRAEPSGRDVVAALDAATMGPTYRAGVLRTTAIEAMEKLEREAGMESVAYEMLGPPRLSKVLFEGQILRRIFGTLAAAAELDPSETAVRAAALLDEDDDLRQRILTVGLPVLLPDGERLLRGATIKVPPPSDAVGLDEKTVASGWIDLRETNWDIWKARVSSILDEMRRRPGVTEGSRADHHYGDEEGAIRPGRLASWVFCHEDEGQRIKR
jgi:NAD(P)-dependent dehydrogenase (short-subunit alcohol dehydrogenase family)